VYLYITADGVRVEEPDDCTRLEVRAADPSPDAVDAALRAAGMGTSIGPTEVDLRVDALRALAATAELPADWPGRWDMMIAYAARKGWLVANSTAVRAHVVAARGLALGGEPRCIR
jgi:hypothetical protein